MKDLIISHSKHNGTKNFANTADTKFQLLKLTNPKRCELCILCARCV